MRLQIIACILGVMISCTSQPDHQPTDLDIQGHRGCRGIMPENTIEGFIYALELGVTTLEMDVVISKDKQVVLSHEPFMSHLICKDSLDNPISEQNEKQYNLYQMEYHEIRKFDCGSKEHPWFTSQKSLSTHKPLLKDVVKAVEGRARHLDREDIRYNIETKIHPQGDNTFHPPPQEFVQLLLKEIFHGGIQDRTTIQSFDVRTLQVARELAPEISLALLVENQNGVEANLNRLRFHPNIYSPEHILVDKQSISYLKNLGIQIIPWTVNQTEDMEMLIELGVDGIITDYPDRLIALVNDSIL